MKEPSMQQKSRRSIKNFALQPFLQVKIGLYCLILSMFFALAIGLIVYINMNQFFRVVVELTGAQAEVEGLLLDYLYPVKVQVGVVILLYVVATMLITLRHTHRFVGPTVAFRRHIEMISQNNFKYRTILRDGDAFVEVANDLNRLSEQLEFQNSLSKETQKKQ